MRASHLREYRTSEISIMKQLSDMLQRTADGAMPVNEDGTVILWNKAAERLLGFLAQDVIGHPFLLGGCEPRPGAMEEA
jgi:PAS domain S-box-containing protein